MAALEAKADKAEQYSRQNCIQLSGIIEERDANTDNIVLGIAKDLGVDLNIAEIDRSHRLGKPTSLYSGLPRVPAPTNRVRETNLLRLDRA